MSYIVDVFAREVLDSRGNPTVEVDVVLAGGLEDAHLSQGGLDVPGAGRGHALDGDRITVADGDAADAY